jgi:hypothetical protein
LRVKAADDELYERLLTLRPHAAPIDVEGVAVRFGGELAGGEVAELAVFVGVLVFGFGTGGMRTS